MLVVRKNMVDINRFSQMARTFDMKDLAATKTIHGHGNKKRRERW